jgi:hypothetical protein
MQPAPTRQPAQVAADYLDMKRCGNVVIAPNRYGR